MSFGKPLLPLSWVSVMKKVSDGGLLPTPSNPFQWLIPWLPVICKLWLVWTLLASAASNGCCCVFVFWIKKCFMPWEGTTDCDPVCGSWEAGRVFPWVFPFIPEAALGNSMIMQENCWAYSYIYTCSRSDPCAHIRELWLETQELLCKGYSSLCPISEPSQISRLLLCPQNLLVTSAHSRDLSFPPMCFLGAHCKLPVSLLLPNVPMQSFASLSPCQKLSLCWWIHVQQQVVFICLPLQFIYHRECSVVENPDRNSSYSPAWLKYGISISWLLITVTLLANLGSTQEGGHGGLPLSLFSCGRMAIAFSFLSYCLL